MQSTVFFYSSGTIESPVRLAGGSTPYEGRLEIFHEGRWGTVCNNGFDATAAKIICNSIGYPRYKTTYTCIQENFDRL